MTSTLRFIGLAVSADNQKLADRFRASPLQVGYGCQLFLTFENDTVTIRVEPIEHPEHAMVMTPAPSDTLAMIWLELNDIVAHQTTQVREPGFLHDLVTEGLKREGMRQEVG